MKLLSILLSLTLADSLFRYKLHDSTPFTCPSCRVSVSTNCRLFCETHGNGICYENNCEATLCVDGSINRFYCAPGTVFNPRVLACDWPYCLHHDHPCYKPCATCGDLTEDSISEECQRTVEVMQKP